MVRKEMDVNYITMQYNQMGLISTMELAEVKQHSHRKIFKIQNLFSCSLAIALA